MKQRCPKRKRFEKKEHGTLGVTKHVGFVKVSWKLPSKHYERVQERGTEAYLSCGKGYERRYKRGYECTPFVQNLRITPCRTCLS